MNLGMTWGFGEYSGAAYIYRSRRGNADDTEINSELTKI